MKNLSILCLFVLLTSCAAQKVKIMDTPAVSMTRDSLEADEKLEKQGPVNSQFCPDSYKDKGEIGLMDEAVRVAQEKNQIDFILNASFWSSVGCISVEGEGAKIVKNFKK
jgi:hypothetical protein